MKNFLLSLILLGFILPCHAQSDSLTNRRRSSHYLGVQANQLIRQLVNFGNSNNTVNNPYLLVWSVNSKQTGWGMNTGLGLNVNQFTDGDNTNKRTTDITDLNFRIGFEKKSMLAKRWMTSWGFDLIHQNLSNNTNSTNSPDPNNPNVKSIVDTKSSTTAWGFGPRFTLNFIINSKIILGTEATYYYRSGTTSLNVNSTNTFITFDNFGRQILNTTTNKSDNSSDFKSFQFNLPVAVFVLIKF